MGNLGSGAPLGANRLLSDPHSLPDPASSSLPFTLLPTSEAFAF